MSLPISIFFSFALSHSLSLFSLITPIYLYYSLSHSFIILSSYHLNIFLAPYLSLKQLSSLLLSSFSLSLSLYLPLSLSFSLYHPSISLYLSITLLFLSLAITLSCFHYLKVLHNLLLVCIIRFKHSPQKRFYTRETIGGRRISRLAEILPLFNDLLK